MLSGAEKGYEPFSNTDFLAIASDMKWRILVADQLALDGMAFLKSHADFEIIILDDKAKLSAMLGEVRNQAPSRIKSSHNLEPFLSKA